MINTINEIDEILKNSDPNEWQRNESRGLFVYRSDVNLRIERDSNFQNFDADWLPPAPNEDELGTKPVCKIKYSVKYNQTEIIDKYLILIDGVYVLIPLPTTSSTGLEDNKLVTSDDVNFAKIVTICPPTLSQEISPVNEYINRCGFNII
jgi:hypothetical protein